MTECADRLPLRLFGSPSCTAADGSFFPSKGFALVTALLLAPRQSLSRQVTASLLWGEVEQKRALGNLRQLILRLQKLSGETEGFVVIAGSELRAGELSRRSDLGLFLAAMKSESVPERLSAMKDLSGELLDGIEAGDESYYIWLLSERRRLKDMFYSGYVQLLEDLSRYGRARTSDIKDLCECAFRLDPDREEIYRAAMAAYARVGNVDESNRVFRLLSRQLSVEGRAPEAATLALHRRVESLSRGLADVEHGVDNLPRKSSSKPRVAFLKPTYIDGLPTGPIVQAFVEDIANSLVRFRTFCVLAPHSTFLVEDNVPEKRYARLRADYHVVSRVFDQSKLSVALVEDASSEIIWSLEILLSERRMHEAFRMLSKQVAASLAREIERLQLDPERSHHGEAYSQLLEGQQLLNGTCELPRLRRARSLFRKAIDLDRGLATARARIAQTLQLEWLMLGGGDPHLLHRAKAEADASIDIDPALGAGHWMCAVIALYQRDFDRSAEKFFEAEALAPNSADLLLQHADALAHFGDCETAWSKFQEAIDLNPLAPDIYWWAGASIAFKREDYGEAVQLCQRMDNDEPALRVLTASHALHGDLKSAHACGARLQEIYPGMSAKEISGLSPDRDAHATERFCHALRMAGLR